VTGVNDPPEAREDKLSVLENQSLSGINSTLLANDFDIDVGDTLSIARVDSTGTRGIVTLVGGQLSYSPGPAFDGLLVDEVAVDTFRYTITDPHGATDTKTVTVTVVGESDRPGDLNGDNQINHADIDLMCGAVINGGDPRRFDLDKNGEISMSDHDMLIRGILKTTYGDANLDGVFDTTDLVLIFQAGQYGDGIENNSNWAVGDWNCDRDFDSSDLIVAFQWGGFSQ
jgi:VCBS repeat-containing protein